MKAVIALATVVFALSLCNLTGRKSNTNSNANSAPPGNMTERSEVEQEKQIGSGLPPASQNQPPRPQTSKAGAPSSIPGVNQNTAPKVPRGPISGGVLNGKATHLPKPAYPAIAKAANASGTVNVQVLVDENGNVLSAHAVSGHPLLKQSAVAAARGAKFRPTLLSGQPVKVSGIIVYNFVAQ